VQVQSDAHGGLFGTPITLMNIYKLNPLEHFVAVFRNLMYDNRMPSGTDVLLCIVWALGSMVVGVWVFRRSEKKLAELL
jgi:ABC-type polysaccharide/polyol phosphate export permease